MPPPPTPLLPPAVQAVIIVTPEKKKIERILSPRQFQKASNAGSLAVALAMHMFGETVLLVSLVTGDHGRRKALDEEKFSEINVAMYQGKINDIEQLWKGCKKQPSPKNVSHYETQARQHYYIIEQLLNQLKELAK